MTKTDQSQNEAYLTALLERVSAGGRLLVGRMLNRTVKDHWGCSEAFRLGAHHVTLVSSGEALFGLNGETVLLRSGTLLYTSPNCVQTYVFDPANRPTIITARFKPEDDDSSAPFPRLPAEGCFVSVTPWKQNAYLEQMEHLHRCWIHRADPLAEHACSWGLQSMLWSLSYEFSQPESDYRDLQMEEVRLMLDAEPEANASIADLATKCGLSAAHFSRRFRQHVGTTAKSYQVQCRMKHARHLLQDENFSVNQVAERLGYSDAFVFSRQFKKFWGMPPSKA